MAQHRAYFSDFITAYKGVSEQSEIVVEDFEFVKSSFRKHLKNGRASAQWPEYLVCEQRTLDSNNVLTYEDSTLQTIDICFDIFPSNPFVLPAPKPMIKQEMADGWVVFNPSTTTPYVKYMPIETSWDGDNYSASTAYAIGDVVFYGEDFYECIETSTGNLPTDTDYWEKKWFSDRLLDFLANACYADRLMNSDITLAGSRLQYANSILADQQFLLLGVGKNMNRITFETNNSKQQRR